MKKEAGRVVTRSFLRFIEYRGYLRGYWDGGADLRESLSNLSPAEQVAFLKKPARGSRKNAKK